MADVNRDEMKKQKRSLSCDLLTSCYPEIQISDYKLVGRYCFDEEDKIYVMELTVGENIFQGIGLSKKKARSMAAENALVFSGKLEKVSDEPHKLDDEPFNQCDFTADNIHMSSSRLFYDFVDRYIENDTEDDDEWLESLSFEIEDEKQHLVGKNTISILSELHPDITYKMVSAIFDKHKVFFVMSTFVNGIEFKGSGPNKRLAKARAAREVLKGIYKMEFGILEDGMPVYEGDEEIWRWYKTKLEERAIKTDFSKTIKNALREIHELYPDVKFSFPYQSDKPESDSKFTARIQIEGQVYEGEGTSKKLAKVNVAAAVIDALMNSGIYDKKVKEINDKKKARDVKRLLEKPKIFFENLRSAISKLNQMRPLVEYKVLAETPLKNTCITAFTVGVSVDGKDYISVGKNKRMAKLEVAEKVLKDLGAWTEEDEEAKNKLLQELLESDNIQELNSIRSEKGPVDLMKLVTKDMSRREMLKMVNQQLGLNLPNHLFTNDVDIRNKRMGSQEGVSAVLDELDMLVESVLGPRSGQDADGGYRSNQKFWTMRPSDLERSRDRFKDSRNRFNDSRRASYSNFGNNHYRSRPYDDRKRSPLNHGKHNLPSPNIRSFNRRRSPPHNLQDYPNVSCHHSNNWIGNDQTQQLPQNETMPGMCTNNTQQNPPNYWQPHDYPYNHSSLNKQKQKDAPHFAGNCMPTRWANNEHNFNILATPPPPPPTPVPHHPGFSSPQAGHYSGQQGSTTNFQGYNYTGYFNQWGGYQNTNYGMQP